MDRSWALSLSALAAITSLVLVGACIAITILAYLYPPIHGTPALAEGHITQIRLHLLLAGLNLLQSTLLIVQLVTRTPVRWSNRPVAAVSDRERSARLLRACVWLGVVMLGIATAGWTSVESLSASPYQHITDSPTFVGLGLGVAITSGAMSVAGQVFFSHWWTSRPEAALEAHALPVP